MKLLLTLALLHLCHLASGEVNLQDVEIPDMDDFSAIKEKCDKSGGNGTYDTLKAAKDSLQTCLQDFVDFSALKNEVEEAKKTGSMDEVFGRYCAKRPKVSSCVQRFTTALRPCLNDDEKKALNITLDILKQLGEFVCFRDGDRIAMFVAEGGVECIKDHVEGIKKCVNSTLKITPTVNTNSLPSLLMDKKKCDDLRKLQDCVVEELEKCKQSTPANIVDALFRFIKRSACPSKNKRSIHGLIKRSIGLTGQLYNPTQVKEKIVTEIKKKCAQNNVEGGFEAFTESLDKMMECIRNKSHTERIFVTPVDKFKENFKTCTKDAVEATKNCLPEEEKYWPQFQVDMVLNLIDFAYKTKNKMNEPAVRTELFTCLQNFKQSSARNEVVSCLAEARSTTFNKEDLCKNYKDSKACIAENIKKRCIREITITKLFNDLFESMTSVCNEE